MTLVSVNKLYLISDDGSNDCWNNETAHLGHTISDPHHTSGKVWGHIHMIHLFFYEIIEINYLLPYMNFT